VIPARDAGPLVHPVKRPGLTSFLQNQMMQLLTSVSLHMMCSGIWSGNFFLRRGWITVALQCLRVNWFGFVAP
jgi:hypothetical protein